MTPELWTAVLSVIVTAAGVILVPLYVNRRIEKGRVDEAAKVAAREAAEDDGASWEAFNKSIVQERNRLIDEIKSLQAAHRIEMQRVHDRHHEEITSMRSQWETSSREVREQHETEIASMTVQIASLRREVAELHAEIYKLQHPPRDAP